MNKQITDLLWSDKTFVIVLDPNGPTYSNQVGGYACHHHEATEISATDWEIEEPKVEITKSQFYSAYADVWKRLEGVHHLRTIEELLEPLAKELGLE